jgi:hypothetical protein
VATFRIAFSADVPPEERSPASVEAERYRVEDASFVFYNDDTIVEILPMNKVRTVDIDPVT